MITYRHPLIYSCFLILVLTVSLGLLFPDSLKAQPAIFPWLDDESHILTIADVAPVPEGFERPEVQPGSFAMWLRHLPVKSGSPPVFLFNGHKKKRQNVHHAVLDVHVGNKDLQQCADAVMRLRGEYLYFSGNHDAIHFNFTSGDRADFTQWARGFRPKVRGNSVTWERSGKLGDSYEDFRAFMEIVMVYAGTASLSRELKPVSDPQDIRPGDVFIQGGFPGHAVLVVDVAIHQDSGKKIFLLVQSYMPAQDIHILKNPGNAKLSPWYEVDFGDFLITPEWMFKKTHLMRFAQE